MDGKSTAQPQPGAAEGTDAIRADIERTRQDLGVTVAALAGRAEFRSRAQERAAELSGQARSLLRRYPVQLAAATAGLVAGLIARRRRRAR